MNSPIRFGKYILLDKIGSGGMAELFLAKQTGLSGFEKVVAIKRILPHLTQATEFVDMFVNEAKLAALLSHQNIVQIYDLGSVDQSYYIAMEYIMGRDLRTVLHHAKSKKTPISIGDVLLIVSKICSALDYAHRKKDLHGNDLHLVHRDISPQNILLSYEGEVKLVDFGIAKAAMGGQETKTGVLKGKLAYMSPEQAWGKPVDRRTDIFALGIVLYEAATGERLFKGNDEISILEKVRKAEIAPPAQFNPAISPEMENILLKALSKEAENRYQSAAEMQVALEETITQKGYAFSSLSLSHFMQTLYQEEIERDTKRFRLITGGEMIAISESDRRTIVRPRPSADPQEAVRKSVRESKTTLPPPRGRGLSRWIAAFFFLTSGAGLFLLLLLSDLTFIRQVRAQFPILETTRTAVHRYLDDKGLLARLENFKTGLFSFVEGKPERTASSVSAAPEEDRSAASPPEAERLSAAPAQTEGITPRTESDASSRTEKDVPALFQEAKESYNAGRLDDVEKKLLRIIEIDPNAVTAYHLLGTVYEEKKESDAALRIFSDAADLFPKEGLLRYDLGFLYFKKGVDSLTAQELTTALRLAPQAPESRQAREILRKLNPRLHSSPPAGAASNAPESAASKPAPSAPAPPPLSSAGPTAPAAPAPSPALLSPPAPLQSASAPTQANEAIRSLILRQKRAFEAKNLGLFLEDHLHPPPQLEQRMARLFDRFDTISVNYEIYELKIEGKEASASLLQTIVLSRNSEARRVEKALVYWKLAQAPEGWKIDKMNVVEKY